MATATITNPPAELTEASVAAIASDRAASTAPVAATDAKIVEQCADAALLAGREYRLSVKQYTEMVSLGILTEQDRVELIEGRLVTKMSKTPPHVLAVKRTFGLLYALVPANWHVTRDDPVSTLDGVPEPDISVLRGQPDAYADRVPEPGDVGLVVEVADSSLPFDQRVKRPGYARAEIPIYWIVNIPDRRLEVHSAPTGPAGQPDYRVRTIHGPEQTVPLVLDGAEIARIAVRDLLP